ncbi:MAG: hypothetical protein M1828_007523 [Chrysothrix sp. TS-e1954]|nr:MAG: hypothetical protein M1828_007523 [Chrysothrix sp. TS-e1954]
MATAMPGQQIPKKSDMGLPETVLKTMPSDSESDGSEDLSQKSPTLGGEKDGASLEAGEGKQPIEDEKIEKPEPRMDGGIDAWMQVVSCFCLYINTWGIINSFGVFQTYYSNHFLSDHSQSAISWIGSVQGSLLLIMGFLTGPLYDAGYMRHMIALGSILSIVGMMLTSICKEYYQFFLAQGVLVGLGTGLVFLPSMSILPQFWSKKKALAQGIASLGSSIGAMIYPVIFRQLILHADFGWATRTMAFCMLALSVIPIIFMHQRMPTQSIRSLFDKSLAHDVPYLIYCAAFFFGFMGIYIPFFYIEQYGLQRGDVSQGLAPYLLVIVNGGSVLGRLIPNYIADKIGPLETHVPMASCGAILVFAWIAIRNVPGVIVFCVLYGIFSGTFVSLGGPMCATLAKDLKGFGTRMGLSIGIAGIGLLVGNPIAGAVLDSQAGWPGLQAWSGALMALSSLLLGGLCIVRIRKRRKGSGS